MAIQEQKLLHICIFYCFSVYFLGPGVTFGVKGHRHTPVSNSGRLEGPMVVDVPPLSSETLMEVSTDTLH